MSLIKRLSLALLLALSLSPAFGQVPPPVPALPDAERRTSYSISASTCACAVGFQLYGDSTDVGNWLEVSVNGVPISQAGNWNITSPTGPIGNIPRPITDAVLTFTAPQTGTVQIVGARRPRRTSQFQESQPVPTRNFNQTFSDIIATQREFWDKTNDLGGRAVLARPGETLALLPVLASRANTGACFDSSGNLTSCLSFPSSTIAVTLPITATGVSPTTIACPTCATQAQISALMTVQIEAFGGGCAVSDNTTALLNAAASVAGAIRIKFPNACTYNFLQANAITFTKPVMLEGNSSVATILAYSPTVDGTFLNWSNGFNVLFASYNAGLTNLTITSADTTHNKVIVSFSDVSGFSFTNSSIGWPFGGITGGGSGSTCLYTHGRDTSVFARLVLQCDKPLRIGMNPHTYLAADHYHFSDLYLITSTGSNALVTADPGVVFTDTTFDGFQAWSGVNNGDGFGYVDTAAVNFVSSVVSGGAGYSAGQILTVSGGTCSTPITIQVNSVSGGVIQPVPGASIINPGVCTVTPTNPVNVTVGTATFNLSLVAGFRLSFSNVRTEQGSNIASYSFNVQPAGNLQGLKISNSTMDTVSRCAIFLKNIVLAAIEDSNYPYAGGGCGIAVNATATNNPTLSLSYRNNYWNLATQTITSLTQVFGSIPVVGTTIPQTAVYMVATPTPSLVTNVTQLSVHTLAQLPVCGGTTEGSMGAVIDSTTAVWGATITGTGANHVLAYCDGGTWTVAGK